MGSVDHLFSEDPHVFVAGDLFWYPVEGHPEIVTAPDTMVAFGRPKGDRGSYRQWEEGGIAPQVVFEVLSPSNRPPEMLAKLDFYDRHGVEEYYIYNPDPDHLELSGYLRQQGALAKIRKMQDHVSPRLKVRFEMDAQGLRLFGPDGKLFMTPEESRQRADFAEREHDRAERERANAEQERATAERERASAERERANAEQERVNAERERVNAERERDRADKLQAELERLRRDATPPGPGIG
jgi:hypothetical protein